MDWLNDGLYMVRDAGFGRDFTPKLWVSIAALVMVVADVRRNKRLDYVWVFVIGTVIWAAAEALLSLQGTRAMPDRVLFDRPIPMGLSLLLQGTGEAAFVAILGLYVGDRWLTRGRRVHSAVVMAIVCVLVTAATVRGALARAGAPEVASRRDLLAPGSLLALGALALIAIAFYVARAPWRPRVLAMSWAMLIFSTIWTIGQVATGGRWVETRVGEAFVAASPGAQFAGLAFDVIVEIVLAYVPFLAIPVLLGLIRDPRPLGSSEPVDA